MSDMQLRVAWFLLPRVPFVLAFGFVAIADRWPEFQIEALAAALVIVVLALIAAPLLVRTAVRRQTT